jgi:hypothetical protein
MVFDSEICEDCEEGRDALKWMLVNTPRDYTILPAARPATRLEDFAWATAAITLFLYLLWSLRGWWIEWFEMWLHSGS